MGKYIIEKDAKDTVWRAYYNQYGRRVVAEAKLTPYTEPDIEQVRKEAYEEGVSDERRKIADLIVKELRRALINGGT